VREGGHGPQDSQALRRDLHAVPAEQSCAVDGSPHVWA
jgi:hypothetical protein